ncbi:MAG: histone deacetylase family protein [Pseudomonadota bacterium]
MKAFFDRKTQSLHDPQFYLVRGKVVRCFEQPRRAELLEEGLKKTGIETHEPADFGFGPIAEIHTPDYLNFLKTAFDEWQKLPGENGLEVVANIHPQRYTATYPSGIVGRAGWHMADTSCPLGRHTFEAALASAQTALSAADHVAKGAGSAYALCRPPGHHAFADMAGGFCFLNNSAIAAQYLRSQHERVAILDVDVHHGNGTQGIFWRRRDVLTISLHCDPANYYPFHWGHRTERGEGDGEGFNLNLPIPPLSGDLVFMDHLAAAKAALDAFAPGVLVVALGLDASEMDPLRGLSVTTPGFEQMGAFIAGLGYPTVYIQEGGYLSDILSDNLASFMKGATGSS